MADMGYGLLKRTIEIFQHRMLRVLLREDGFVGRYRPVNAKALDEDRDASIGFGMIEIVAFILEHSGLAQHGKAMSEAFRDEELTVVVFGQLHSHMLAIGRRAFAYVDSDVEHGTLHATHQLALGEGRTLKVKTTHHAIRRHALVVLTELYVSHLLIKLAL